MSIKWVIREIQKEGEPLDPGMLYTLNLNHYKVGDTLKRDVRLRTTPRDEYYVVSNLDPIFNDVHAAYLVCLYIPPLYDNVLEREAQHTFRETQVGLYTVWTDFALEPIAAWHFSRENGA